MWLFSDYNTLQLSSEHHRFSLRRALGLKYEKDDQCVGLVGSCFGTRGRGSLGTVESKQQITLGSRGFKRSQSSGHPLETDSPLHQELHSLLFGGTGARLMEHQAAVHRIFQGMVGLISETESLGQ
jgi:hypothetical protein